MFLFTDDHDMDQRRFYLHTSCFPSGCSHVQLSWEAVLVAEPSVLCVYRIGRPSDFEGGSTRKRWEGLCLWHTVPDRVHGTVSWACEERIGTLQPPCRRLDQHRMCSALDPRFSKVRFVSTSRLLNSFDYF